MILQNIPLNALKVFSELESMDFYELLEVVLLNLKWIELPISQPRYCDLSNCLISALHVQPLHQVQNSHQTL